jgi:hypothetical protein
MTIEPGEAQQPVEPSERVDAPGFGLESPGPAPEPESRTRTAGLFVVVLVVAILGAGAGAAIVGLIGAGNAGPTIDPQMADLADKVYAGLPPDARRDLATELERLLGDRVAGKTPTQIATEAALATARGFARLDDATLVRRLELQTTALDRATTRACAAFMRMAFGGVTAFDLSVAAELVLQLDESELTEWYRLSLDAIRAELNGTPARRSVTDDEFFAAFTPISDRWSAADIALINAVTSSPATATDEDVCRVAKLVYGDLGILTPADRAVIALYDINPPGS